MLLKQQCSLFCEASPETVALGGRCKEWFKECRTLVRGIKNRIELPVNGGSGCWICHALNKASFNLKYTSPLIATASLT